MPNSLNVFLDLFRKRGSSKTSALGSLKTRIRLKPELHGLKLSLEKDFHDDLSIYSILNNKNFFGISSNGDYFIDYENLKNNFLINLQKSSLDKGTAETLGINFSSEEEEEDSEGEGTLSLKTALDEDRKILDYFPVLNTNKEFKVTAEFSGSEIELWLSMKTENGFQNITDKIKENGLIIDLHPKAKKQSLTVLPYWIYQLFDSYINQKELWSANNPVIISALQKVHEWITQHDSDNSLLLNDLRLSDVKIFHYNRFDLYAAKSLGTRNSEDLASLIPFNEELGEVLKYENTEKALEAIQRGLRNWDTQSHTIKIKTAHGENIDLGLNPSTKKALLKLKTDYHHKASDAIIEKLKYHSDNSILKELPEFYNIFNLDVSQYGPRVIGIGKPIVIPGQFGKVQQKSIFDGIDKLIETESGKDAVHLEDNDFIKINLGDSNHGEENKSISLNLEDLNTAKGELKLAAQGSKRSVVLQDSKTGEKIELDITRQESFHYINSCLDKGRKLFQKSLKAENNSESLPKPENDKALIIQTNAEVQEYDEKSNTDEINTYIDWNLIDTKDGINIFLYQKQCIEWLVNCFMAPYPGVLLADDMGLGKTFQTMCFIKLLMKSLWEKRFPEAEFKPILIVVPPILLDNFEKQAKDFFIDSDEFDFTILHGSQTEAKSISPKKYFKDPSAKSIPEGKLGYALLDKNLLLQHKCIIITYDTMVNYQHSFAQIPWSLLLCDEVQKAKSAKTQVSTVLKAIATNVTFKILMSGTPIENDMSELWNIMDSSHAGLLGSLKDFRKKYKAFFDQDLPDSERENCFRHLIKNLEFGNFIKGYANGRLKSEVKKDLPELVSANISFKLEKEAEEHINSILRSKYPALKKVGFIKQSSIHKFLANGKIYTKPHFQEWFAENDRLNKLKELLQEIKTKNEKALIFCEYNYYQEAVQDFINDSFNLNLAPINSKLSEEAKKDNLKKFQTENGFSALVLSPRCAGMGLNLQEANHVLHLSRWWNPAVEDQATCRAYRTGQKKNVYVYYFVAEHTFEKNLHDRLEIKRTARKNLFDLSYTQNIPETDILKEMTKKLDPEINYEIPSLDEIDAIRSDNKSQQGKDFEAIIRNIFEKKGYIVDVPKDRGVDFIFHDENGKQIAAQVKHVHGGKDYGDRNKLMSFPEVLKSYSRDYNIDRAMFITNGTYKDCHQAELKRMGEEHNIEWINRYKLAELIEDLNSN
jgi:SNF2 family DNA or RNA helicase